MIVPEADMASGEVRGHRHVVDDRIPIGFSYDRPPRVVAGSDRSEQCPTGRHRWDALIATAPDDRGVPDDEDAPEWQRFRLTLTCLRCGLIQPLRGYLEPSSGRTGQVEPTPLQAGDLLAQQVSARWVGRDRVLTSWTVHDATTRRQVGLMSWASTRRGRLYLCGRLSSWPDGVTVEAATPLACLRKIEKTQRECSHAPAGAESDLQSGAGAG